MSFLPLWWDAPPKEPYGGLITPDGKKYRKNIMRGFTESNARFRGNGRLGNYLSYTVKWLSEGGAILSWSTPGSMSRTLDLTDDRRKKFIITYNIDTLNSRMYHALQDIIRSVANAVKDEYTMRYIIVQARQLTLDKVNTIALVSSTFKNPESAILHIRNRLAGTPQVIKSIHLINRDQIKAVIGE